MNNLCMLCTAAIPSPHHTEKCLSKSKEELIAIINGERRSVIKTQSYYNSLKERITFFQGKFAIVKEENKTLRRKLRNKAAELAECEDNV